MIIERGASRAEAIHTVDHQLFQVIVAAQVAGERQRIKLRQATLAMQQDFPFIEIVSDFQVQPDLRYRLNLYNEAHITLRALASGLTIPSSTSQALRQMNPASSGLGTSESLMYSKEATISDSYQINDRSLLKTLRSLRNELYEVERHFHLSKELLGWETLSVSHSFTFATRSQLPKEVIFSGCNLRSPFSNLRNLLTSSVGRAPSPYPAISTSLPQSLSNLSISSTQSLLFTGRTNRTGLSLPTILQTGRLAQQISKLSEQMMAILHPILKSISSTINAPSTSADQMKGPSIEKKEFQDLQEILSFHSMNAESAQTSASRALLLTTSRRALILQLRSLLLQGSISDTPSFATGSVKGVGYCVKAVLSNAMIYTLSMMPLQEIVNLLGGIVQIQDKPRKPYSTKINLQRGKNQTGFSDDEDDGFDGNEFDMDELDDDKRAQRALNLMAGTPKYALLVSLSCLEELEKMSNESEILTQTLAAIGVLLHQIPITQLISIQPMSGRIGKQFHPSLPSPAYFEDVLKAYYALENCTQYQNILFEMNKNDTHLEEENHCKHLNEQTSLHSLHSPDSTLATSIVMHKIEQFKVKYGKTERIENLYGFSPNLDDFSSKNVIIGENRAYIKLVQLLIALGSETMSIVCFKKPFNQIEGILPQAVANSPNPTSTAGIASSSYNSRSLHPNLAVYLANLSSGELLLTNHLDDLCVAVEETGSNTKSESIRQGSTPPKRCSDLLDVDTVLQHLDERNLQESEHILGVMNSVCPHVNAAESKEGKTSDPTLLTKYMNPYIHHFTQSFRWLYHTYSAIALVNTFWQLRQVVCSALTQYRLDLVKMHLLKEENRNVDSNEGAVNFQEICHATVFEKLQAASHFIQLQLQQAASTVSTIDIDLNSTENGDSSESEVDSLSTIVQNVLNLTLQHPSHTQSRRKQSKTTTYSKEHREIIKSESLDLLKQISSLSRDDCIVALQKLSSQLTKQLTKGVSHVFEYTSILGKDMSAEEIRKKTARMKKIQTTKKAHLSQKLQEIAANANVDTSDKTKSLRVLLQRLTSHLKQEQLSQSKIAILSQFDLKARKKYLQKVNQTGERTHSHLGEDGQYQEMRQAAILELEMLEAQYLQNERNLEQNEKFIQAYGLSLNDFIEFLLSDDENEEDDNEDLISEVNAENETSESIDHQLIRTWRHRFHQPMTSWSQFSQYYQLSHQSCLYMLLDGSLSPFVTQISGSSCSSAQREIKPSPSIPTSLLLSVLLKKIEEEVDSGLRAVASIIVSKTRSKYGFIDYFQPMTSKLLSQTTLLPSDSSNFDSNISHQTQNMIPSFERSLIELIYTIVGLLKGGYRTSTDGQNISDIGENDSHEADFYGSNSVHSRMKKAQATRWCPQLKEAQSTPCYPR